MSLSAQTIRRECIEHKLIEPFCERTVFDGMSYGLTAAGYDVRLKEGLCLYPGSFLLGSTIEKFNIPNVIQGFVHDKSTWARRGLAVQNTVLEPGWYGYITLELSNHGTHILHIKAGSPIAQIVFQQLDRPTELPYTGKYQDQPSEPVRARYE